MLFDFDSQPLESSLARATAPEYYPDTAAASGLLTVLVTREDSVARSLASPATKLQLRTASYGNYELQTPET